MGAVVVEMPCESADLDWLVKVGKQKGAEIFDEALFWGRRTALSLQLVPHVLLYGNETGTERGFSPSTEAAISTSRIRSLPIGAFTIECEIKPDDFDGIAVLFRYANRPFWNWRNRFHGAHFHQKVFEERFLYHADRLGYRVTGSLTVVF